MFLAFIEMHVFQGNTFFRIYLVCAKWIFQSILASRGTDGLQVGSAGAAKADCWQSYSCDVWRRERKTGTGFQMDFRFRSSAVEVVITEAQVQVSLIIAFQIFIRTTLWKMSIYLCSPNQMWKSSPLKQFLSRWAEKSDYLPDKQVSLSILVSSSLMWLMLTKGPEVVGVPLLGCSSSCSSRLHDDQSVTGWLSGAAPVDGRLIGRVSPVRTKTSNKILLHFVCCTFLFYFTRFILFPSIFFYYNKQYVAIIKSLILFLPLKDDHLLLRCPVSSL